MGYADGYYYGQGKLVCNTANLIVNDIIRVRSVTDFNKVWNKAVATVGTPVIFDVPPKDIYKISLVKEVEVDGVPTEVETNIVTKTVDYGQCYLIDTFNKTSLAGAQGILNAHQQQNMFAIGDIIPITYIGSPFNVEILAIDHYESNTLILGAKEIPFSTVYNNSTSNYPVYTGSVLRQQAQAFYTQISDEDKRYIKEMNRCCVTSSGWVTYTDYVWIPNRGEVSGVNRMGNPPLTQTQFPAFLTQNGRIRNHSTDHNPKTWWLPDFQEGYANCVCLVNASGVVDSSNTGGAQDVIRGLMPCFMMKADS